MSSKSDSLSTINKILEIIDSTDLSFEGDFVIHDKDYKYVGNFYVSHRDRFFTDENDIEIELKAKQNNEL